MMANLFQCRWMLYVTLLCLSGQFLLPVVHMQTAPSQPTDVNVKTTGTSELLVSWSNMNLTQNEFYQINYTATTDSGQVSTNETSYVLTGLTAGALYLVGVAACNANSSCSSYTYMNGSTIPNEPSSLRMFNSTTSSVTVEWNQIGQADNYSVSVVNETGYSVKLIFSQVTNASVYAIVSNLKTAGAMYCVDVSAISDNLTSQTSTDCQIFTVPNAPGPLFWLNSTTTSITLTWNQTGQANEFIVQQNFTATSSVEYFGIGGNIVTATVFNLTNSGAVYCLSVTAMSFNLSSVTTTSCQFVTVPPSPSNVHCGSLTNVSVEIQISQPNDSLAFTIDEYYAVYSPINNGFSGGNSTAEFAVNEVINVTYYNATPGVTYSIAVYSVVPQATSSPYPVQCTAVLDTVTSLTLELVTNNSIIVTWQTPNGYFNGFVVNCLSSNEFSSGAVDKSGTVFAVTNESQELTYTCSGLTSGAYYSIFIQTFLNSSDTPAVVSSALRVTTTPQPPANVNVVASSDTTLLLMISWPYLASIAQCSYYNITTTPGGVITEVNCPTSPTNTTVLLTLLADDTDYVIYVISVSNNTTPINQSPSAAIVRSWTMPRSVTNLATTSATQTSFVVSWTQPGVITGITNYLLFVNNTDAPSQFYVLLNCSSSDSTVLPPSVISFNQSFIASCNVNMTYTVNGLSASNSYMVSVEAINPGGNGEPVITFISTSPSNTCDGGCIAGIVIGVIGAFCAIAVIVFLVTRQQRMPSAKYKQEVRISTNPAFESDEQSRGVRLTDFEAYTSDLMKDSGFQLAAEFELLENKSNQTIWPQTAALLPQNKTKNRFSNILPYDHTRVKLMSQKDSTDGSDYINASFVKGNYGDREYIAAQGPNERTLEDFWRMLWEQNVSVIVMLTNLVEAGKKKCEQYWPPAESVIRYGDLQVTLISENWNGLYVVRSIRVTKDSDVRHFKQFHFTAWPDFNAPSDLDGFLNFVAIVQDHSKSNNSPTVVHCSAGVGRTGTFILIDRLLQLLSSVDVIDVFGTALELRSCRQHMVQSEVQYKFVYECMTRAISHELLRRRAGHPKMENVYANFSGGVVHNDLFDDNPYQNGSVITFRGQN